MSVCHIFILVLILVSADAGRTRAPVSPTDCEDKGCSHNCETVGEFPLCTCPHGLQLGDDGRTCTESTSFLLAMYRGVRLHQAGSQEDAVAVAPVKARCLDYHYDRQEVYVYTNYTVMRYPLARGKAASPVSLVAHTDTAITSLAVDWANDVIYHVSQQQLTIGVMSLDGKDQRSVISHNASSSDGSSSGGSSSVGWHSLVVDPYAKKLFWVGTEGVYAAGLEGQDLATGLVDWLVPDRIAVDTEKRLVYAIGRKGDRGNKYIARATYNGAKAGEDLEVAQPASAEIFGFGVVGDTAYWESNHDGENIYKCSLNAAGKSGKSGNEVGKTGKVKATLVAEVNQIVYDMKVYHKDIQKSPK